jgi:hypothetical protein
LQPALQQQQQQQPGVDWVVLPQLQQQQGSQACGAEGGVSLLTQHYGRRGGHQSVVDVGKKMMLSSGWQQGSWSLSNLCPY